MNESFIDSPIGKLHLIASNEALINVEFVGTDKDNHIADKPSEIINEAIKQLEEYFEGKRTVFKLPLSPKGTDFQEEVWKALLNIPYGRTISYSELSLKLENPKAIRAVGKANGQNPMPIIIPCHRVIGSNNNLVGYGGGIERKRWLLQHEGALLL